MRLSRRPPEKLANGRIHLQRRDDQGVTGVTGVSQDPIDWAGLQNRPCSDRLGVLASRPR
jgi:hypothetical protein